MSETLSNRPLWTAQSVIHGYTYTKPLLPGHSFTIRHRRNNSKFDAVNTQPVELIRHHKFKIKKKNFRKHGHTGGLQQV